MHGFLSRSVLTSRRYARYVVAEALNVHGKSLGKSRPVQTIPAVEQVLDLPASGAAHAMLTSQIVAAVIGFVTCGVLCALTILAMRNSRAWPRWRAGGNPYEPLTPSNQEEPEDEEKVLDGG